MGSSRVALTFQYLGTDYAGWQAQDNALAIQTVAERVLSRLYKTEASNVRLHGSARTDSGVHARMQVAHFDAPFSIPEEKLLRGINDLLPRSIRAVRCAAAAGTFHSLRSAVEKEYRYRLFVGSTRSPFLVSTTGLGPPRIDLERISCALAGMAGERDFALFSKKGSSVRTSVRDLREASIRDEPAGDGMVVSFTFRANGFLRGTVRLLVGTLVEVGRGKLPVDAPAALLAGRISAGRPGPCSEASGLFLWRVTYPAGFPSLDPPADSALW